MSSPPAPSALLQAVLSPLSSIGAAVLSFLTTIGALTRFAALAVSHMVRPPYYPGRFFAQLISLGYFSLPVVGLTALFTGAALAQQIYVGSVRFNAESAVAGVVVIAIVRELGPVLAGLMVAGRVSSAMAAELGTMRVTEQIDALTMLSVDPMKYLVAPRILAAIIVMPILVLVANIIGVYGGFLVGTEKLGFNAGSYLKVTVDFLERADIVSSMVKAGVFGFILSLMGCYHGYKSSGGAQGVGRATTDAVVSAFILILLANLIITIVVFGQ